MKILAEMGRGGEVILVDAHFPGHTFCRRVLRAHSVLINTLQDAVIPVFELDRYASLSLDNHPARVVGTTLA